MALYDFNDNSIILSRDRLGVAPLYYRETQRGFYFSSSIQSLIDIEPSTITIDPDTTLGFIQTSIKDIEESTCYSYIKSFPPSTALKIRTGAYKFTDGVRKQYWRLPTLRYNIKDISFTEAVSRFRKTFFNAVDIRLRADVKVACKLSGGLDSSSITAVAAMIRHNDITSYTIKVPEVNEEPYASTLTIKYPIDYRVISDPEYTFLSDAPAFTRLMEEPYHSPNIYTHYKMRETMKQQGVSVVLSGAGGDEVLAGYEAAFWPQAYVDLANNGHLSHALQYEVRRMFMTPERSRVTIRNASRNVSRKSRKVIRYYGLRPLRYIRDRFFGKTRNGAPLNSEPHTELRAVYYKQIYKSLSFHEQAIYHFKVANLPYYLSSNDHFTMAIPLEHRFPFLDYRIVEFGLQMPSSYLFKNGWTKYILRKAMEPYLPKKILWRKDKVGFPFPFHRFLAANRHAFEPLLRNLKGNATPINEFTDYNLLMKSNPLKLWRLVSTALWLQG